MYIPKFYENQKNTTFSLTCRQHPQQQQPHLNFIHNFTKPTCTKKNISKLEKQKKNLKDSRLEICPACQC